MMLRDFPPGFLMERESQKVKDLVPCNRSMLTTEEMGGRKQLGEKEKKACLC